MRKADWDWGVVKRLFVEALQQPAAARAAWLDGACADREVRSEVQTLLDAHEQAGTFLEEPCTLVLTRTAADDERDSGAGRRFEPGDWLGRYRIEGLLARGGMGEVYRARDTRLDRTVVLKVLPASTAARPDWRARLEREARAVSSLNHPHVCALYDIGQHGSTDFLVMEHLEGETLAERLGRTTLPFDELLTCALQILDALEAAHQRGIVHRDLKPENVMLTSSGVKLLDFGIAKSAEAELATTEAGSALRSLTLHGARVGTANYMAPEQIEGRTVDQRTDLFAFGALLYEMATGRRAFAGEDDAAVFQAVLERDVEPMGKARRLLEPGLEQLVRNCLARDRDARCRTAADARRQLLAIAAARRRLRRAGWVACVVAVTGGLTWAALTNSWPRAIGDGVRMAPGGGRLEAAVRLAVLPFENQTGDAGQAYLSDGLSDALITEIGRLQPQRLAVIARTSSERYWRTRQDATHIGRDLGVDYFIEGSVARAGPRILIAVRLARASDRTQVWGERYDRQLDDILVLQAEIARTVASEIAVAISPEQRARLDARTSTDPRAIEHYMKGRQHWNTRNKEGLTRAIEEFHAAVRRYPGYAEAYAGIADSYLLLAYYSYLEPREAFARARPAATRALELDQGLAEAHVSMAGILSNYDHRWDEAEAEYLRALSHNAGNATANQWYANHLVGQGRFLEAQGRILRARDMDPLSTIIQVNIANIFLLSRAYDRAIEECRKALQREPGFVTALWVLGRAYALKGLLPEAIAEFERGLALEPEHALLRAALARAHAQAGDRDRALSLLGELNAARRRRYVSALNLTSVHAALNQVEEALASLEQAVEEHSNLLIYLAVDPDYDSLRDHPRFQRILRTIGLPQRPNAEQAGVASQEQPAVRDRHRRQRALADRVARDDLGVAAGAEHDRLARFALQVHLAVAGDG